MRRLVTALVLVALVVPAIVLLPSLGFLFLALVVVELGLFELVPILRRLAPSAPFGLLYVLLPLAVVGVGVFGGSETSPALAFGVALVVIPFTAVIVANVPLEGAAVGASLMSLALAYLTLPAVSLYRLHQLDAGLVFLVLAVVAVQDSAAFYVGRAIGRRPLAPRVSPRKTWEGSLAGFFAAMIVVIAWCQYQLDGVVWQWLLLGALAAIAGQLGDLAESVLKRGAGIKDSGTILPGHGGVLDRTDALLFSAPVLYSGLLLLQPRLS